MEHQNITGHTTTVDNFKIISREGQNMARTIEEAIYIRVNNPTLSRNIGKYNLPHIWDKVLFFHLRTKNKIKIPQHYNICALRALTIIDLYTEIYVPCEVHNKLK